MKRLPILLRAAALPTALALVLVGASAVAAAEPSPASAAKTVSIAGTGKLAAGGSGVARLRGTLVVTGAMNGGTLVVDGIDPTTAIRVSGWRTKTRIDKDTVVFRHVHGTFTIAGRTIAVRITSPHLRFTAIGHGTARLTGKGWYRVNDGAVQRWTRAGVASEF